jgi:NAD(P)-dependent dehydrogenase (short-subunit alcohol dehydrogenase family)
MGRAMAMAVGRYGADVLLLDRDADGLAVTEQALAALGRRALAHPCDVSDLDQIRAVLGRVDREFGRIDFLGNVAGDGALGKPEEISLELVERTWRNLVFSRFYMCQEAGRRMLAQGRGSIVNIGSLASVTALGRGHIAYSMAMGAVAQMTRELSAEWSSQGVRVNAILPAQVMNPGLDARIRDDPNLKTTFLRGIPAGRLGVPDDIQGLSVFLASDASSWVTGALIPMDGGNLSLNAGGTVRPRPDGSV